MVSQVMFAHYCSAKIRRRAGRCRPADRCTISRECPVRRRLPRQLASGGARGPLASRAGAALAWRLLLARGGCWGSSRPRWWACRWSCWARRHPVERAGAALLPWFGGLGSLSLVAARGLLRPVWVALGIKRTAARRCRPRGRGACEWPCGALRRKRRACARPCGPSAPCCWRFGWCTSGRLPWSSGCRRGDDGAAVRQRRRHRSRHRLAAAAGGRAAHGAAQRRSAADLRGALPLRLARTALALLGMTHAVIAALTAVFTDLSSRHAALMVALTAPALLPVLAFCGRSLTGGRGPSSATWTSPCGSRRHARPGPRRAAGRRGVQRRAVLPVPPRRLPGLLVDAGRRWR